MKYTKEDIFAQVYHVFFVRNAKQSKRDTDAMCVYNKSVNGYGCAIGCFLTDETGKNFDKNDNSDIKSLSEDAEKYRIKARIYIFFNAFDAPLDLFADLQHWHDYSSSFLYEKKIISNNEKI